MSVIVVVMLLSFLACCVVAWKVLSDSNFDGSTEKTIKLANTTEEFIAAKEIRGPVMHVGGREFRMAVEVKSINLALKTTIEQEIIELTYMNQMNLLDDETTIYIQTRKIDLKNNIESLEKDVHLAEERFGKKVADMATSYARHLAAVSNRTGFEKEKRMFIILSCNLNDASKKLDHNDLFEMATEELILKANALINGLRPIGLDSKILDEIGLYEMLYAAINRDKFSIKRVENIKNDMSRGSIVTGVNPHDQMTPNEEIDFILKQAQDKLLAMKKNAQGVTNNKVSEKYFKQAFNDISDVRNKFGAPYEEEKEAKKMEDVIIDMGGDEDETL